MSGNIEELIAIKAEELFNLCDKEQKGFIIRKDMQCLRDELDVQAEQLENVFDSLDVDHNEFLSLQEFTSGFGHFIRNQMGFVDKNKDDDDEKEQFHEVLETLGAKGLYDDEETIMNLWKKLRETDPSLLRQFEGFIRKITDEVKRSKIDYKTIEAALQSKSSIYNDEIRKLYEEMEQEIRIEKAQVLEQEKLKEREIREQMERELASKEEQLAEMIKKQNDLEMKLINLNLNETETKNDNERLEKEKNHLEKQLEELMSDLEEAKNYITQLHVQTKNEKKERAKQTLTLTESLARERENLVKELDILKTLNKRLVDERDLRHNSDSPGRERSPSNLSLHKQGSILSDYIPSPHRVLSDPEEDEVGDARLTESPNYFKFPQSSTREQPVGGNVVFQHSEIMNVAPNAVPDRMFKVALIGDSGVGKTSFIQRFCRDNFKESFSATIGIDLQVKMMNIDNQIIALQIWDTAGQERYRSITKQYYRKSDGIILMYDVTSEATFRNVRDWMTSIKASAEEDCVIVLAGNKVDLCANNDQRAVKYKDGAKLAEEYKCLFFESSARSGASIIEIMEAIARLMREKDDRLRKGENIVTISQKPKKTGCCY